MLTLEAMMLALLAVAGRVTQTSGPFRPHPLSAFDKSKAAALLDQRLPCLGCHQLNGRGGRIGPPLTDLRARRPPDYVYGMITDPQRTAPGTVMPRVPMSRGMV